jgi:hypothetical protein
MMVRDYPLKWEDERDLPPDYDGPLYVWDIDKTYLSTHFSSLEGLARIPLEFAADKDAIPGMPEVLRGLRRGTGEEFACAPLYFVSASPVQLRRVLEHKMLIDGVEYDGITLKDWVGTIARLRPGRLKENMGFKLAALLSGRLRHPMAREYLFGDDAEKDADAFFLYSRMTSGELSGYEADEEMDRTGVKKDDRLAILEMLEALPDRKGPVVYAFIHLEKRTLPDEYSRFGSLVVPVLGAFQLSLALFDKGLVGRDAVRRTYRAVERALREGDETLEERTGDALERKLISSKKLGELGL